jgi:hypothetical protein
VIAACIAIAGLLVLLFLRERAHDQRETAWAKERNLLLTRIQTPQLAPSLAFDQPAEHEPTGRPLYVPFDDDAAFHAATERESLT